MNRDSKTMAGWISELWRGPTLEHELRLRIAEKLVQMMVPAILFLSAAGIATALLGDPARVGAPLVGLIAALGSAYFARGQRWLDSVNVLVSGALGAAIVESAMFGLAAPTLWVPLLLLPVVIPVHGTRGGMLLVAVVAALVSVVYGFEVAGWVTSEPLTPAQQGLVVVQFTLVAAVLLANPMNLLSNSLTSSEERRRQVEAAEVRFRAIFDQSSSLFALVAPDGTLLDLNAAARRRFGEASAQAVGVALVQAPWWTEVHREAISEAVSAAVSGVATAFELVTRDSGIRRVFSAQVTPCRGPAGDVRTVLLELMDVTDMVEVQQQLHHGRRLEALGQLAGGVAHDFNNMLGAIVASAQLLAEDPVVAADPERAELAGIIRDASLRGAALTRKLLAFGRRDPALEGKVDIGPLLDSTCRLLRRTLGGGVDLVTELAESVGTLVGDSAALESALVNLAINARDAMPDGGVLMIRSAVIQLDATWAEALPNWVEPGPTLRITVEDSGEGIPPDVLAHIFEPFFTTKGVGQGTGLGLAAVHGTVVSHGGAVTVQSELGEGTVFDLFIPLQDGVDDRQPVPIVRPDRLLSGLALVVDDEAVMRRAVSAQLRAHGLEVRVAGSVDEALRVVEEFAVDLVVTDVVMPDRNGFELVSILQKEQPGLPVIAMTGFTRLRPAAQTGMAAIPILRKPFEWESLVEAVEAAGGAAVLRPASSQ